MKTINFSYKLLTAKLSNIIMNLITNATDIYLFFVLTVPIILSLTVSNLSVLLLFTIVSIESLLHGNNINQKKWEKPEASSNLWLLKSHMNWFEISKLLGGLAGIIAITYYRYYQFYSHNVIVTILGINMGEAILSDLLTGSYYNAAAGIILFLKVPWTIDELEIRNLFLFPLSFNWILGYTTWNAAFSYGFNYSLSTRLILLSSIIVSYMLQQPYTWLSARTYGLVVNMILRSIEITYLYTPDKSIITTYNNRHNPYIRILWGLCNFAIIVLFV